MREKKWVITFFCTLMCIGFIPNLFVFSFLSTVFEHNSYEEIVKRQIARSSIYGTALNQNTYGYKLELVKAIRPDVVAVGSSRVMQFREEFFKVPFVSAGGGMNHLNEGVMFVSEMLEQHVPEYIILGLDFWWFNDNCIQPAGYGYHSNDGKSISIHKLLKTFYLLFKGDISADVLRNVFHDAKLGNKYTDYDNLGLRAVKTSDGFRKDGSYLYAKTIFGVEPSKDAKFADTYVRIKKGIHRFEYGSRLSKDRVAVFETLVDKIKEHNVKLIVIVPPLSSAARRAMSSHEYRYIKELFDYLSGLGVAHFNFHELSSPAFGDCEFIDGFHGGDVLYQKMLMKIYDSGNYPDFSKLLNIDIMRKSIEDFSGKTLSIYNRDKFFYEEVDFLDIGCMK